MHVSREGGGIVKKPKNIGNAAILAKIPYCLPVLWSRSRKEPKLMAGAGTGAGTLKFRLRVRLKKYLKIIIHIE